MLQEEINIWMFAWIQRRFKQWLKHIGKKVGEVA